MEDKGFASVLHYTFGAQACSGQHRNFDVTGGNADPKTGEPKPVNVPPRKAQYLPQPGNTIDPSTSENTLQFCGAQRNVTTGHRAVRDVQAARSAALGLAPTRPVRKVVSSPVA